MARLSDRCRTLRYFRVAVLLLLPPLALGACADLGIQLGSDRDKADTLPAYMNPDAEDQTYDPAMETYARAYNLNFSFWQTNFKALLDSLGSTNVLETRNAYEQGRKHLTRMSKFLAPADREKLMGYVAELDRIYKSIRNGVANRAIEMRLVMLERRIRGSFEPGVVQLVAPAREAPPHTEPQPEKTEPEGRGKPAPSPLIGLGEKAAQKSVQPDIATDMTRYRALFSEWQSAHRKYIESVRKDGQPGSPESLTKVLETLQAMRLLLRDERKASHLHLYILEYERLRKEAEQSKSIEKLVRDLDVVEKGISSAFSP